MGDIIASKKHLREMLLLLSKKTGLTMTVKDFKEMEAKLDLSEGYLYKKIFLRLTKDDVVNITLRATKLDQVANYLKFDSYAKFVESLNVRPDDQLESFVGNYYCYLRKNSSDGIVFKSPVRITKGEKQFMFELKGPATSFVGTIVKQDGCIFILMNSASGKNFYHIYKIGNRKLPKLLQGVFSGVSTSFEPIGGRTIIIRAEEVWDGMTNKEIETGKMMKSKDPTEKKIGAYFDKYENNNVAPYLSYSFNDGDLVKR